MLNRAGLIHTVWAVVVLIASSIAAHLTDDGSWFALLIVYTAYLALQLRPRASLLIAVGFAAYASLFNLWYRRAEFSAEFFFVIIVWLVAAYVPSMMQEMTRRYRESEAFHRSILQATPHGIVQTDLDGTITYCNRQLLHIVGAEEESQLLGRNVLEFILPEKREKAREVMKQTHIEGSRKNIEYTACRLDGSTVEQELSIALSRSPDGHRQQPSGYTAIVRDITEEKRHQQEALRFRQLLDTVRDAILIHSVDEDRIVDVNETALRMSGYSREEMLQKSILDFDLVNTIEEQEGIKEEVLQHGTASFETMSVLKDGSTMHTEVKLSKIDMLYEPYLVSVVRDITRAKEAEQEVRALLREKEQLLREVHHRIKNHMNTISSIISLNMSYHEDERVRRVLSEINGKITVMQNIYRNLYVGEDVTSVRLPSFLNPLLDDLRQAYSSGERPVLIKEIEELTVSAKQSLPVGIIVNELVTNALKYAFTNARGGTVTVTVRREGEGVLLIRVADDGAGFPAEVLESGSYGFGLTLVEGYAQQFHGSMDVGSEGGAAVSVRLQLE